MLIFDCASSITRPSAISHIETAGNNRKKTKNMNINSASDAAVIEYSVNVG